MTDEVEEDEFGPESPDYDLSEEYGYLSETGQGAAIPQWLMVAVTVVALIALAAPTLYLIWRFG